MRGNERHTIFQICYFATNLDVLSWCFRVFYDFCFQFEIDHPPPTPISVTILRDFLNHPQVEDLLLQKGLHSTSNLEDLAKFRDFSDP